MPSKLFIVGQPDSPVNGQSIFTSDFLGCTHVNFMFIDNVAIAPQRDFVQSLDAKTVDISPQQFVNGSYVIFDISPIKCECCI